MKFPHPFSAAAAALTILFSLSCLAVNTSDLKSLEEKSFECMKTKDGKEYHNKFFNVLESTFNEAMAGCLERTPDTKEQHPAEFLFIIRADGRIKNFVYSTDIPFGRCVGPRLLRLIKSVPRPPGDNWVVLVGLGNEYHRLNARQAPPQIPAPVETTGSHREMAPYIAKARATYPAARHRFITGLPAGYRFYVQLPLHGANDTTERCFVFVESIKNGKITGTIDRVGVLRNYKTGQRITFPESEIDNWLIAKPDGTEDGNFVGKSLNREKSQ
jgi:uncharacterized protein YegJ (DUF2314 family)